MKEISQGQHGRLLPGHLVEEAVLTPRQMWGKEGFWAALSQHTLLSHSLSCNQAPELVHGSVMGHCSS